MSKETIYTHLLLAVKHLVNWIAYVTSVLVNGLQWSTRHFPNATRVVEGVVIAYILWRGYVRLMRIWWRLVVFVVKIGFFYAAIFVILGVYLRGLETFLIHDTLRIWSLAKYLYENRKKDDDFEVRHVDPFPESDYLFMRAASNFVSQNKDIIDSVEDLFHEAKNQAGDFLRDSNIQENLGPNLRSIYDLAGNFGLF